MHASQIPPPMSPQLSAPPIKKVRAENTGDTSIVARAKTVVSNRRAELQKLQKQGMENLDDRVRNATMGAPFQRIPARSAEANMRGGGRPSAPPLNASGPPPLNASNQPPLNASGPPPLNASGPPPIFGASKSQHSEPTPAKPVRRSVQPRKSDLFPQNARKQSPVTNRPVITALPGTQPASPRSAKPAAAVTAAALKSPVRKKDTVDENVARRLETSFAEKSPNVSTSTRSKSAPPARPPPPPRPSPAHKEEPVSSKKGVSFTVSSPKPSPPPAVKMPPKATPFPKQQPPELSSTPEETVNKVGAGSTPYHPAPPLSESPPNPVKTPGPEETKPSPPATGRREFLRTMRAFADTPEKSSPEMSLQDDLDTSNKENSSVLRPAAPFPNSFGGPSPDSSGNKVVGFASPAMMRSPDNMKSPLKKTPFPKKKVSIASTPKEIEDNVAFLKKSVEMSCFEFMDENFDFEVEYVIRRPYGLANAERDLWFKCGQMNANKYAKQATADEVSSLEIVAKIGVDNSFFTVFANEESRYLRSDGTSTEFGSYEKLTELGVIEYIDNEGNEKEYLLRDIFDGAKHARDIYVISVLETARNLKEVTKEIASKTPKPVPEVKDSSKQENGTANEKSKEEKPTEKSASPPPTKPLPDQYDDAPGGVGIFQLIVWFLFAPVWFVLGLIWSIVRTSIVLVLSGVIVAFLWIHFVDKQEAELMGATTKFYANRPII